MYDDFDTQVQSDEFASEYEEYLASLEDEHMEEEFGDILQWLRRPASHVGNRGFESPCRHHWLFSMASPSFRVYSYP